MGSVANLWRHPIKGVGREELRNVTLESGRCMPMDRNWAIAHENSKVNFQNPEWASCLNFVRAASNYELMAATRTVQTIHQQQLVQSISTKVHSHSALILVS